MTRSTSTKPPRDLPNNFTCAGFSHFVVNSSLAWLKNCLTETNKNELGTLHLTSERLYQTHVHSNNQYVRHLPFSGSPFFPVELPITAGQRRFSRYLK